MKRLAIAVVLALALGASVRAQDTADTDSAADAPATQQPTERDRDSFESVTGDYDKGETDATKQAAA